MKKMIYLFAFQIPVITFISSYCNDWRVFLPLFELFILLPVVDIFIPKSATNFLTVQEKSESSKKYYDYLLYSVSLCWFLSWGYFIWISASIESWYLLFVKAINLGIGCGIIGINVAHELGHRRGKTEQLFSKCLLATSLYMHFLIEHNRGHHKYVATPLDPASARFGESLYQFLPRTIIGSFMSAWKIAYNKNVFLNKTFQYVLMQLFMLLLIFIFFGTKALVGVFIAAVMGILLLEVVNYIEHYGLQRKCINGKYEKVSSWHSWNSDHWVGRVHLFELSRHSDHHYLANRKYQVLRSLEDAPQLPTGYPGMILISLIPWLWFKVMNPRVESVNSQSNS